MSTLNAVSLLERLRELQDRDVNIVTEEHLAYLDGGANASLPQRHQKTRNTFHERLKAAKTVTSYAPVELGGNSVDLDAYPALGRVPDLHGGLEFLDARVSHACLMLAEQGSEGVRSAWFGRRATEPVELWSSSKFISPLLLIDKVCAAHPTVDLANAVLRNHSENPKDFGWGKTLDAMVSYEFGVEASNARASMLKNFFPAESLVEKIKSVTGNTAALQYGRNFGNLPGLLTRPALVDADDGQIAAVTTTPRRDGENLLSVYDLVRILAQVGLHPQLGSTSRLKHAQWKTLRELVTSLGNDTSLFLDAALSVLGVRAESLIVLSKMGFGPASPNAANQMTYVSFFRFVQVVKDVARPVTGCLGLRFSEAGAANGPFLSRLKDMDCRTATAVAQLLQVGLR